MTYLFVLWLVVLVIIALLVLLVLLVLPIDHIRIQVSCKSKQPSSNSDGHKKVERHLLKVHCAMENALS